MESTVIRAEVGNNSVVCLFKRVELERTTYIVFVNRGSVDNGNVVETLLLQDALASFHRCIDSVLRERPIRFLP